MFGQQRSDQDSVLVLGAAAVGRQTKVLRQLTVLKNTKNGMAVANIHGQEHECDGARLRPRAQESPFGTSMAYSILLSLALLAGTFESGVSARAHFSTGMKALNSGRPLRAAQAFEQAANEAPDWGLAFLQWGIALQLYSPESPDVVRALEHAVMLTPVNARAHFHLAQAYLNIS